MKNSEIFSLIKKIATAYDKEFNLLLKPYDLTASQCDVLDILFRADGTVTNRDIEHELALSNPTVAGILRRLEDKGFLEIARMEEDRRKHRISLSEKAGGMKVTLEEERKKLLEPLTDALSDEEEDSLRTYLENIFSCLV